MSHKHGWPYEDPSTYRCTELPMADGSPSRVCLRPTVHGGNPDITNSADGSIAGGPTEHLAGFIIAYDWPGEEYRLEGGVTVDTCGDFADKDVWQMTGSLEGGDLTLNPSVQAYKYISGDDPRGHPTIHGYVRNGKWVE